MITNKDLSIDSENGKITLNGNKYDLGTQGEIDTAVKDVYSVMGQNGAKNLIPYPYYNESGHIDQGLTVTYDADGVFTINKVAGTAMAYYRIATLNFLKPSTKYRVVFEVENATSISIYLQKPTTGDYVTINNKSSGIFVADFETTADSQISSRAIGLSCTASDTETNATVKVMLMLASDTDNTYEPYAMTNKQLTEKVEELAGSITYTDITVNKNTTGYAAPVESAGGVYYETLATYAALDIPKDKILNIILVDWHDTAKSFNYYLGAASVGVLTDSAVSIYKDTAAADLTLRIVYKN